MKPHHVFTEQEVKAERLKISYWLFHRLPLLPPLAALLITAAWAAVGYISKDPMSPLGCLLVFIVVFVAAMMSDIFRDSTLSPDSLRPLTQRELDTLGDIVRRLPGVAAWVSDALSQEPPRTLRERDLQEARKALQLSRKSQAKAEEAEALRATLDQLHADASKSAAAIDPAAIAVDAVAPIDPATIAQGGDR